MPGLDAKDVIDVQITVSGFSDDLLKPALGRAGFVYHAIVRDHTPPGMTLPPLDLEKRLLNPAEGRRANVHMRIEGRWNQRYPLLCRDYLRSHPDAANAYAEIKRQLARYFPSNSDAYYDIKDPVFDVIMAGAEDWARFTDWKPGASDA